MDPQPVRHVVFPKANVSCEAEDGDTLVDAVLRNDLPIRFKCERSVCGTCLTEVLKGGGTLDPPNEREKQTLAFLKADPSWRLACQLTVRGDLELDYLPVTDPRRVRDGC